MDTKFNTRQKFQVVFSTEYVDNAKGVPMPNWGYANLRNAQAMTPKQMLAAKRKMDKLNCRYWTAAWRNGARLDNEQIAEVLDLARDAEMGIAG